MTRKNLALLSALAVMILVAGLAWLASTIADGRVAVVQDSRAAGPAAAGGEAELASDQLAPAATGRSASRRQAGEEEAAQSPAAAGRSQGVSIAGPVGPDGAYPRDRREQGVLIYGFVREALSSQATFSISCRKGPVRTSARTDHLGNFQLRVPGAGTYWFTVAGDGRHQMAARELGGHEGQFVSFEFEGGSVEGRVQSSEGAVLEGVDVRLKWTPQDGRPTATIPSGATRAKSDHDGRFRFERVPVGHFRVTANATEVDSQLYAGAESEVFEVGPGEAQEGVVLALEPKEPEPLPEGLMLDETWRGRHGRGR